MNFTDIMARASKTIVDNSPGILTGVAVAGTITTAVLAGKASFEAADIIRLKEADDEQRGELELDPKERTKQRIELVWQLYIPAVGMGVATVACVVAANRVGARRAAAMAAAYSITERSFHEYRDKVVETIGEKKEAAVRDSIIQDRINATWDDSIEVHGKVAGEVFYDKFGGGYVYTTREQIEQTVNRLNQIVVQQGYATLADFYGLMEMPQLSWSYEIGWNSDSRLMEPRFSSALTPANKPVGAFEFDTEPTRNYARFHH